MDERQELEMLRVRVACLEEELHSNARSWAFMAGERQQALRQVEWLRCLLRRAEAGGRLPEDLAHALRGKAAMSKRVAELLKEKDEIVRMVRVAYDLYQCQPTSEEARKAMEQMARIAGIAQWVKERQCEGR